MKKAVKGFTLVELLVVVTIVFILAFVATPQFLAYRASSHNAAAYADIRNFKTSMEAALVENQQYPIF